MKALLYILLSFILLSLISYRPTPIVKKQFAVTYTWRYYSTVDATGSTSWFLVGMPSDSLTNPTKRPVYGQEPGSGETGGANNTLANARKYGWARDLYLGLWDGAITQSNGYEDSVVYPIYMVAQRLTSTNNPLYNLAKWEKGLSNYESYIDRNQIHIGGISLGGKNELMLVTNRSNIDYMNFATTHTIISPGGTNATITDSLSNLQYYASRGGRIVTLSGSTDGAVYHYTSILPPMNTSVAGSAVGRNWTLADGMTGTGHCCWDSVYKYNRIWNVLGNKTLFQYPAQFTKQPKARSQNSIITGTSNITLNGVSNGWYKTVTWTQISGPAATITSPNSDTTTVTGLTPGSYQFRLTVTNTHTSETAVYNTFVTITGGSRIPKLISVKPKSTTWKIKKQ